MVEKLVGSLVLVCSLLVFSFHHFFLVSPRVRSKGDYRCDRFVCFRSGVRIVPH